MQLQFKQAVSLHQQGDLAQAEKIYQQIHKVKPADPGVCYMLGTLYLQTQRPKKALKLLQQAVKGNPAAAAAAIALAKCQDALGNTGKAISLLQKCLKKQSDCDEARMILGSLYQKQKQFDLALKQFNSAAGKMAGNPEFHCRLGELFFATEKYEEAETAFRRALELNPNYPEAMSGLGQALPYLNKLEEARVVLSRAHQMRPSDFDTVLNYGHVLKHFEDFRRAELAFKRAAEIDSKALEPKIELINLAVDLDKTDTAEEMARQVLKMAKRNVDALNAIGVAMIASGKVDEGYDYLVRAFNVDAKNPQTLCNLIYNGKGRDFDLSQAADALVEVYHRNTINSPQRIMEGFHLAKYFEEVGDFQNAFKYLQEANHNKRISFEFNSEDVIESIEKASALFTPELVKSLEGKGDNDETPLFIIGMPRSGTTLTEQILASHSTVHGGGELPFVEGILCSNYIASEHDLLDNLASRLRHFSSLYIQELHRIGGDSIRMVTDKMPQNFLYLGYIGIALPKAKIVHCRRQPLETCLSIFKQNFQGFHGYAYDLEELGAYYQMYERLMQHWKTLFGDRIIDVEYEQLVADPEHQTRRLLDACDLEFEESCLEFYKTRRAVKTASISQVRQPVYKSSLKLSEAYGEYLEPLIVALGAR